MKLNANLTDFMKDELGITNSPESTVAQSDANASQNINGVNQDGVISLSPDELNPQGGATTPPQQTNATGVGLGNDNVSDTQINTDPNSRDQQQLDQALAQQNGPLSYQNQQNEIPYDPRVWTAEDTERGFISQIGRGMAKGLGEFVIAGTGDLLQVAGSGLPGISMADGNVLSRALQTWGKEFAEVYGTQYVPDELKDENIKYDWKTVSNPQFWTIRMSEFIPQLAEFLLISHGTSALARKVTASLVKGLAGEAADVAVKSAESIAKGVGLGTRTAKGLTGAARFLTAEGTLTTGYDALVGSIGGGAGGNILEGLQNAAQTVNKLKLAVDENGNRLYSDQELAHAGNSVWTQNLEWMAVDALSWGITYGKAFKTLKVPKALEEFAKTGRLFSKEQQLVAGGKKFANYAKNSINRLSKLSKFAGKTAFEAKEEEIQEVWQNWVQAKAESKATGKSFKHDHNFIDYFYSPEQEATRVISASLGGFGAGNAQIVEHINKLANKEAENYNKNESLKKRLKSKSSFDDAFAEITSALMDNHLEGKPERNEVYLNRLKNNGQIDDKLHKRLVERNNLIGESIKEGAKMNYLGRYAYASAKMKQLDNQDFFEQQKKIHKEKLELAKQLKEDPKAYKKAIEKANQELANAEASYIFNDAKARNFAASLLVGETVNKNENVELVKATDGTKTIIFPLSEDQLNKYYKQTDEEIFKRAEKAQQEAVAKVKSQNSLGSRLKNFFKTSTEKIKSKTNETINNLKNKKEDTFIAKPEVTNENLSETIKGNEAFQNAAEKVISKHKDESIEDYLQRVDKLPDDKKKSLTDVLNEEVSNFNTTAKSIIQKIKNNENLSPEEEQFKKKNKDFIEKSLTKEPEKTESKKEPSATTVVQDFVDNEVLKITEDQKKFKKEFKTKYGKAINDFIGDKQYNTVEDLKADIEKAVNDGTASPELKKAFTEELVNGIFTHESLLYDAVDGNGIKTNPTNLNNNSEEERQKIINSFDETTTNEEKRKLLGIQVNKDNVKSDNEEDLGKQQYKHIKDTDKKSQTENPNQTEEESFKEALQKIENERIAFENNQEAKWLEYVQKYQNGDKFEPSEKENLNNSLNNYALSLFKEFSSENAGNSVLLKALHLNQFLIKTFGDTKISVVPLYNLRHSLGENAMAYAFGSTIYIDEKAWEQDGLYMHEFAHIYYNANPDSKIIKDYLSKAIKNKSLVKQIEEDYPDLILYRSNRAKTLVSYSQIVNRILKNNKNKEDFTVQEIEKEFKRLGYEKAPQPQQRYINEELFVATLQGPLSKTYNKYFEAYKEPARQYHSKKFWARLKENAKKNDAKGLVTNLIDKNVVDLRYEMINGFVNEIKGKKIDVRGMAARVSTSKVKVNEEKQNINNSLSKNSKNKAFLDTPIEVTKEVFDKYEEGDLLVENEAMTEGMQNAVFQKSFDILINKATSLMDDYLRTAKTREQLIHKDSNKKFISSVDDNLFKSKISYIASKSETPAEFIYAIKNNPNPFIQGFFNHIKSITNEDKAFALLRSTHKIIQGSVVIEGQQDIIEDGYYRNEKTLAGHEKRKLEHIKARVEKQFASKSPAREIVIDILKKIKNKTATQKDLYNLLLKYSDNSIEANLMLESGYIEYNSQALPLKDFIEKMQEKGLLVFQNNNKEYNLTENTDIISNAILSSSRRFTHFSTQTSATGNQVNSRQMKSGLYNTISQMNVDLVATDENGKPKMSLLQFKKKYQHIQNLIRKDKFLKDSNLKYFRNNFLHNIYTNYHSKGVLPTMSKFVGTQFKMNEKQSNNVFADSTAEQEVIQNTLRFLHAEMKGETWYDGSPFIFGDSSQKYLMSMPILSNEDISNNKEALMQTLHAIESHSKSLNMIDGKRVSPVNLDTFKRSYNKGLQKYLKEMQNNAPILRNLELFKDLYNEKNELTLRGKKLLEKYYLNDFANKGFMQEIYLPNVAAKDIQSRSKGIVSPVIPLDKNLDLEVMPIASQYVPNQYDKNGEPILSNDSDQYILLEDAMKIVEMGHGVVNFNHGYKLVMFSQEHKNPNFKDRTIFLKGYTSVVSLARLEKEPELRPIYDALMKRKSIYKNLMKEKYGEKWEEPSRFDTGERTHLVIGTSTTADKIGMYDKAVVDAINGTPIMTDYDSEGKRPDRIPMQDNENSAYHRFLDRMNYKTDANGKVTDFVGVDASNFGIQQRMDNVTKTAKMPTQTGRYVIAQLFAKNKSPEFKERIIQIQKLLFEQATYTLKENVLRDILNSVDGSMKSGEAILKHVKKGMRLDKAIPLVFDYIDNGGTINSPYIQDFAVNHISNEIKNNGIIIRTPGNYAQQVTDMGYRLYGDHTAFKDTFNRNYLKGFEPIYNENKNLIGNKAAHIVLPKNMQYGDNAVRARKSFIITDKSLIKSNKEQLQKTGKSEFRSDKQVLTAKLNQAIRYALLRKKSLLKQLKLSTDEELINTVKENKITDGNNVIGYYVPGEYVIATRVPVGHIGFTGVFEAVDFRSDDGNQVIVSTNVKDVVGSDNDGDALIINIKSKEGSKKYDKWNEAFDLMTRHWLSPEMDEFLKTNLDFITGTQSEVNLMNRVLKVNENEYIPINDYRNVKKAYNNGPGAKSILGQGINMHGSVNLAAAYKSKFDYHVYHYGKKVTKEYGLKFSTPVLDENGNIDSKDDFASNLDDWGEGLENRIMKSSNITQIIVDAKKFDFVNQLNLTPHTVEIAIILANEGFSLSTIGLFLNHPVAKDYFNRMKNSRNPFSQRKSVKQIKRDMIISYGLEDLRKEVNAEDFKNNLRKQHSINLIPDEFGSWVGTNKYNSKRNSLDIIQAITYHLELADEFRIINKNMSGHNESGLESNPMILRKNMKDFDLLIKNSLPDQKLVFEEIKNNDKTQTAISDNYEIKKYRQANEHLLNVYESIVGSEHPILKKIAKHYLETVIDGEKVSNFKLRELTRSLKKILSSRALGINNISTQNMVNLISPESPNNIFYKIRQAEEQNFINKEGNDNFFNNVIDYSDNVNNPFLFINRNLTQISAGKAGLDIDKKSFKSNFDYARESFAKLPSELQKDIIVADFILNGFGQKSLFPIYPLNIVKALGKSLDNIKMLNSINENVMRKYNEALLQKEINGEWNGLRKIYINESKATYNKNVIVEELKGQNLKELRNGKDFLISVISQDFDGINTHVNKDGKTHKIFLVKGLTTNQENSIKNYAPNNRNKSINENKKARTILEKQITEILPVERQSNDIDLISVKDSDSNLGNPKLIELIEENKQAIKKKVKTKPPLKGMAATVNLRHFENSHELTKEAYFYAVDKPRNPLSQDQQSEIYRKYKKDYIYAQKSSTKKQFSKEALKNISDKTLSALYQSISNRDVYAFAPIIMKITEEKNTREMRKQIKLTGIQEGNKDISLLNAYFQANNASASHPATQAAQRQLELQFKAFQNEKKRYAKEINKITEKLYAEKFGKISTNKFINKLHLALKTLFKSKKSIYETLYGNITEVKTQIIDGVRQKSIRLLNEQQLKEGLLNNTITQTEYDFARYFKSLTKELHTYVKRSGEAYDSNYVPVIAMETSEAFSSKGLLGLLANSKSNRHAIGDVKLSFGGKLITFKEIEDSYRAVGGANYEIIKDYIKLRLKARKLLKKGINEDGSSIEFSGAQNDTINGDGMINAFANDNGWTSMDRLVSMDLNKALHDYMHSTLFVNGNNIFKGFQDLQFQVDALMLHNAVKGFDNQNKMIRRVLKEMQLQAPKLKPTTPLDKIVMKLTRANLFYILGWKMLLQGKGLYALGNLIYGKYGTVKDIGGKAFLEGEKRFWSLDKGLPNLRRGQGILKSINFQDINIYDEVNFNKKQGLDGIFGDLALMPMIATESWAQGVHMLGLLTEEQMNLFDDVTGEYKPGVEYISKNDIIALEDRVKGVHGRGYSPTDQRLIQSYSWGKMMMQFSRFLPTTLHDRFAKEDINKYGQKHIGSLRALGQPIYRLASGEITPKEFMNYRSNLEPEKRQRLDSGLRGLALTTASAFIGSTIESNTIKQLNRDANIYVDSGKLGWRATPPLIRTIHDLMSGLF